MEWGLVASTVIANPGFISDLTTRTQGISVLIQTHAYLALTSICDRSLCVHCSVFGEDALVNVSVEKKDDNDGKLAGYIRIRSKTQGIALSLGDRITSVQRGAPEQIKQ